MLVTVDIGNTNITIGIFDKEDLIGTYRLTTKVRRTSDEYGFMLKNFLDRSNVHEKQIDAILRQNDVTQEIHHRNHQRHAEEQGSDSTFMSSFRFKFHHEPDIRPESLLFL